MVEWKNAIFRVFSGWKTLLLGIIISIVPILNFATYGFALECARKPYDKKLPSWRRFGTLWVQGLLAIIIMVLYALPAAIAALFSFAVPEENAVFIFIIAGILGLLAYYFLPMAWLAYALGDFRAAFDFGHVMRKCLRLKYVGVWLVVLIVSFIIALVLNFLSFAIAITIIGPFIIAGVIGFWLSVFAFTIYGQLYEELR